MQAFEFNGIVDNGAIRIPERYIGRIPSVVKVIVLAESSAGQAAARESSFPADAAHLIQKKRFTAMSLDTRGFKFDRDEAND